MLVQHREGEKDVPVLPCTSTSPGATLPSPESHLLSRIASTLEPHCPLAGIWAGDEADGGVISLRAPATWTGQPPQDGLIGWAQPTPDHRKDNSLPLPTRHSSSTSWGRSHMAETFYGVLSCGKGWTRGSGYSLTSKKDSQDRGFSGMVMGHFGPAHGSSCLRKWGKGTEHRGTSTGCSGTRSWFHQSPEMVTLPVTLVTSEDSVSGSR